MAIAQDITNLQIKKEKYENELEEVKEKIEEIKIKKEFCKNKKLEESQITSLENAKTDYHYATTTAQEAYNKNELNPKAKEMEETWYEIDSIFTDLENQEQYINKTITLLEDTLKYWKDRKIILEKLIADVYEEIKNKLKEIQ